jgi:hypothetical protein
VHLIADNFSTYKANLVKQFPDEHPNVKLHFALTYPSWLNQVESWFSKLQWDAIDRGIFTSVADLELKILRYIRVYQKTVKPFQWRSSGVRKRIPEWQRFLRGSPLGRTFRCLSFMRVELHGDSAALCPAGVAESCNSSRLLHSKNLIDGRLSQLLQLPARPPNLNRGDLCFCT